MRVRSKVLAIVRRLGILLHLGKDLLPISPLLFLIYGVRRGLHARKVERTRPTIFDRVVVVLYIAKGNDKFVLEPKRHLMLADALIFNKHATYVRDAGSVHIDAGTFWYRLLSSRLRGLFVYLHSGWSHYLRAFMPHKCICATQTNDTLSRFATLALDG